MQKLLIVCLGNICRSPMAEGAVRHVAAARGLDLMVDSAGTGGWYAGEAPDPRSIDVCRKQGVDITQLRARQITVQDFHRFDLVLAMDGANLLQLQNLAPSEFANKIHLFGAFAGVGGVADPYYGGLDGFVDCWQQIERATHALLDTIESGQV